MKHLLLPLITEIVLFVLLINVSYVHSFNLDIKNVLQYNGPKNSMFGYSVTGHQTLSENWIIVGAPKAQTNQPGVTTGGTVFRCSTLTDDTCYEIQFDRNGANNFTGQPIDKKSEQWFGATVVTDGPDSPIMACAPRYVWFTEKSNRRDPVGTCYVANSNLTDFREFSPCRTKQWGYHRQGFCQAGFSAAISKDADRIFIGAPGSWYWQGQLYSVDSRVKLPFYPPRNKPYGSGQVIQKSLKFQKTDVYKTSESPPEDDDSYLGYSIALGDFNNDGQRGVAVGMPRGSELLGKVILYTWNLTNIQNITGEQLGAYFGYSIISVDIDGDHFDDLIIGAPLYTVPNNDGKYDVGRVYVVYQGNFDKRTPNGKFKRIHKIDGINSRSRFGISLASLGDINLDGYGDFAVGAPYDGPHERGAVYIFHGSSEGIRNKYSQVIYAEDVSNTPVYTFGFSISGNMDLDKNEYNDLIVGAYSSESVFLIKSKPIVKMSTSMEFESASKQISLEENSCQLRNKELVPCTNLIICMNFDGIGVRDDLVFDVQLILDSKKSRSPRLFFIDKERQNTMNVTWRLNKNRKECQTKSVYIRDNIQDKLTPIDAEIRYELVNSQYNKGNLVPILDQNTPVSQKDSISVQKNCGSDNICIPDLILTGKTDTNRYLLGSNERLNFNIKVENRGEDSFETIFLMFLPNGINFVNTKRLDESQNEIPVQCSTQTVNGNSTLKCDIGNPLPQNKFVHFIVVLEPYHASDMLPSYDFKMLVNSTNPEMKETLFDNSKVFKIDIWVETDLTVQGSSHPEEVHYNSSLYSNVSEIVHENDIGPQLVYIYNIRNNGPSAIEEAEVYVLWPYQTLDGDDLIYLLDQIETSGPIKCQFTEYANYHNYRLDKKKSSLELHGISKIQNLDNNGIMIEQGDKYLSQNEYENNKFTASSQQFYEQENHRDHDHQHFRNHEHVQHSKKFSASLRDYRDRKDHIDNYKPEIIWSLPSYINPVDNGDFQHRNFQEVKNEKERNELMSKSQNNDFRSYGVDLSQQEFDRNTFMAIEEKEAIVSSNNYDRLVRKQHKRNKVDLKSKSADNSYVDDHMRRTRRQLSEDEIAIDDDKELENVLKCHVVKCTVFQCKTGTLNKEQEAWIAIRSRIYAKTLDKIFSEVNKPIELSSMAVARISRLPYIGEPKIRPLEAREVVVKITRTDTEPISDMIPLWLIILAVIAGILVLLLLAYLLKKCGFFNRNRPNNPVPEQQLLNRNGNFHGDEQL